MSEATLEKYMVLTFSLRTDSSKFLGSSFEGYSSETSDPSPAPLSLSTKRLERMLCSAP